MTSNAVRIGVLALLLAMLANPGLTVQTHTTVRGQVLDDAGRPLVDARVELLPRMTAMEQGRLELMGRDRPMPRASTRSQADGNFVLSTGEIGMWRLRISALGFVTMEHFLTPGIGDVELPAVRLSPSIGLELRVVDAVGRPLAGARVMASTPLSAKGAGGWQRSQSFAVSDDDGRVVLERGMEESLRLAAFAPGFVEAADLVPGGEAPSQLVLATAVDRRLRVLDEHRRPVAGVLIRLGQRPWAVGYTDDDGLVTVPASAAGSLLVEQVDATGTRGWIRTEAPSEDIETAVLPAPTVLRGQVVDAASGQGLAGAIVWRRGVPEQFLRTTREGRYELAVPPVGEHTLAATAAGYLESDQRLSSVRRRSSVIALGPGAELRGRVTDDTGRPLAGVRVVALARPGAAAELAATATLPDGVFRLPTLAAGRAGWLSISKEGFVPRQIAHPALAASISHRLAPLTLAAGRLVFGRVASVDEQPIADAEVELRWQGPVGSPGAGEPDGALRFTATSQPDGHFEIIGVPAGRYQLMARASSWQSIAVPGLEITGAADPFDAGTLFLAAGAALAGQVVDRTGSPLPEVSLVAWPSGSSQPEARVRTRSADDGTFLLQGLQPTPVDLAASASGFVTLVLRQIEADSDELLTVVLEGGAVLAGQVWQAGGGALPKAVVTARFVDAAAADPGDVSVAAAPPPPRVTVADSEGRFEIRDLAPGRWRLLAEAQGHRSQETASVELAAGEQADGLELVLELGGVVEGRAVAADGEALAAARIRLLPRAVVGTSSGGPGHVTVSDASGSFRFEGVAMGRYSLIADRDGYQRRVEALELAAASLWREVVLSRGLAISGRVVDGVGRGVEGALLTLESLAPLAAAAGFRRGRQRTRSASDGRFRLAGLDDGVYRLRTEKDGFATTVSSAPLELHGAAVEGLEIELSRGGRLSGRILGLELYELGRVEVEALSATGLLAAGRLDFRGSYQIPDLGPGLWQVHAWSPASGRLATAEIRIEPGDGERELDLELHADE